MATTSDIRKGAVIYHKNKRMKVLEFLHVKPGKGPAFVRTKLKDIASGKIIDETFNAGMKLDFLKIEAKKMQQEVSYKKELMALEFQYNMKLKECNFSMMMVMPIFSWIISPMTNLTS